MQISYRYTLLCALWSFSVFGEDISPDNRVEEVIPEHHVAETEMLKRYEQFCVAEPEQPAISKSGRHEEPIARIEGDKRPSCVPDLGKLATLLPQSTEAPKPQSTEAPQPVIRHSVNTVYGPRTLLRGQSVWLEISHGWYKVFPYTVDPVSDFITAPGHPFVTDSSVKFFGGDTLPFPLSSHRAYRVCDLEGDRFRVLPTSASCDKLNPRSNFADVGRGIVLLGQRLASHKHVKISNKVTGLPPGVTAEIWCQHFLCPKWGADKLYSYAGAYQFLIKLTATADAAVGPATLKLTVEAVDQAPQDLNIPINVEQLLPLRLRKPRETPSLPSLAKWERLMDTLSTKWCKPGEMMGWGASNMVWFYNGPSVFWKAAKYLNKPALKACAENIASQYRDYVIKNNGRIRGYDAFPRMMEHAYHETKDPRYGEALTLLALNGTYFLSGGTVGDWGVRETAYHLDGTTAYQRLTGLVAPSRDKAADLLIGIFDQLFVSDTFTLQQIFMDGLAMRSLIEYWDLTGDPRVPVVIKTALDWIWDRACVQSSSKLMVNPEAYGPRCDWGCKETDSTLINLTAPAYAWYWFITGDPIYQQRADRLFERSLDADISYHGKQFSQNYTWSFDYVRWRQNRRNLDVEPFTNSPVSYMTMLQTNP